MRATITEKNEVVVYPLVSFQEALRRAGVYSVYKNKKKANDVWCDVVIVFNADNGNKMYAVDKNDGKINGPLVSEWEKDYMSYRFEPNLKFSLEL